MQFPFDPVALLGADYTRVAAALGGEPPKQVHDAWEAGQADEQYGEAIDGTWQCLLDGAGRVRTIFLFARTGCPLPLGLRSDMGKVEVAAALGPPTKSGLEQDVPLLGRKGSWARWDRPLYSLHIEYSVGSSQLEMVTLRLPSAAPKSA